MKLRACFEIPDISVGFSPEAQHRAGEFLDLTAKLEEAKILFTGWGLPRLDAEVLREPSKLR